MRRISLCCFIFKQQRYIINLNKLVTIIKERKVKQLIALSLSLCAFLAQGNEYSVDVDKKEFQEQVQKEMRVYLDELTLEMKNEAQEELKQNLQRDLLEYSKKLDKPLANKKAELIASI